MSAVHSFHTKLDDACGGRPPLPGIAVLPDVRCLSLKVEKTYTTIIVIRKPARMKKMPTVFMCGIALLNRQTQAQAIQVAICFMVSTVSFQDMILTEGSVSKSTHNIGYEDMPGLCHKVGVGDTIHLDDGICCDTVSTTHANSLNDMPNMKLIDAAPKTHASQFQYPA